VKVETKVQAQAHKQDLKDTLGELERLHTHEAAVLRTLTRDALDDIVEQKLKLWERLRSVTQHVLPEPEDRATLERIRHAALLNQILLHHARDAVRTILQEASGQPIGVESVRPQAVQDGLRVDFRG
jgi:FixJ family two-component response regulator